MTSTTCSSHHNLVARDSAQELNDLNSEMQELVEDPNIALGQGVSAYQREEGSGQAPQNENQRIDQGSWIQNLYSSERFSISNNLQMRLKQLNGFVIFLLILVAIFISLSILIQGYSGFTIVDKTDVTDQLSLNSNSSSSIINGLKKELGELDESWDTNQEVYSGSMCEKISSYIFSFLTPSSNFHLEPEELDQIEDVIEKYCPSSLENIDLEIFLQLGCLYSLAKTDGKFMKWLSKIEDTNSGQDHPQTLIKAKIILGNWYRQLGNYALSEIKLKEAEEKLTNDPTYLKTWLDQSFGMLYLARYLESNSRKEKEDLYEKMKEYFNEAVNENFNGILPLMAGPNQCNIQISEKIEGDISMREISIRKEELEKDEDDALKMRNEEMGKVLDKIFLKENNMTNLYKKEISKALNEAK